MHEVTHLTFTPEPVGNVLYSHHYLKRLRKATTLESQAKEAARRIIRDANSQADVLFERAQQDGFQQGLLLWMDTIAEHITIADYQHQLITARLQEQLAERLRIFFDESQVILQIIKKWLDDNDISAEHKLMVSLPQSRKHLAPVITTALKEKTAITSEILFNEEKDILVKSGSYVLSFRADLLIDKLTREVINGSTDLQNKVKLMNTHLLSKMKEKLEIIEKEMKDNAC